MFKYPVQYIVPDTKDRCGHSTMAYELPDHQWSLRKDSSMKKLAFILAVTLSTPALAGSGASILQGIADGMNQHMDEQRNRDNGLSEYETRQLRLQEEQVAQQRELLLLQQEQARRERIKQYSVPLPYNR